MMKERTIRIVILSVVFIVAVIGFSYWTNRGSAGMTADMGSATLPTISFELGDRNVNTLVGHVREMNINALRDAIIVYEEGTPLAVRLHHLEQDIDELKYEAYSLDGNEKLHEETITEVKDTLSINLEDAFVKYEEVILKMTLLQKDTSIYYYTRVIKDNQYHVGECVEYIIGLHNDILFKQNTDTIKKVMEPNAQGDNTTLQHVTIHSDMDHVLWGDLEPEIISEPSIEVKEAKEAYTSVLMSYQVKCAGDNNEEEIYRVKEFFKVAYGTERVYLIEYDRTAEEIFQTSNVVLSGKGIILGLADENISYKVNEEGTIVAFVQANELWNYNKDEDSFSLIFSFAESEKDDERNDTDLHSIRILSMEESGNMTFSVCGYMNRGMHEGESGIAIYYYNQSQNCVEEEAFIPSTESALVIVQQVHELAYYNKEQDVLYVMVDGVLMKVHMQESERMVLMQGLQKGQYVASKDGHLLAYQKSDSGKIVTEVWDFAKDTRQVISAGEGEIVVPLGFLGDDFVYGVSMEANAGYDTAGAAVQAMHRVEIRNVQNEVLKTYEESGVYILGASMGNNMITLKQGVKDGNSYRQISEDYITNNETSANEFVTLDSYWTDLKEIQYRLVFAGGIKDRKAKTLKPKQVLQEIPTVLEFEDRKDEDYFYVYGHGRQVGIFENAGEAIQLADKLSGVVISPKGNYVWEDGNKVSWYRNFEVSRFTPNEGESTLAACVRKVLSYEGVGTDITEEMGSKSVEKIISERVGAEAIRFRDCSAKDMCYLIDKGTPVIAMKDGTSAILLIGYDAKTVTYVEPSSGGVYTSTFEKVNEMTAGSGNTFVGYVK